MKMTKKILLLFMFALIANFAKSQTGTCGSPKSVTDGTCTATDTFNLAPYYAKFTAATDTTQYLIRVYIQGLSTNPAYSVKLYYDSCSHLVALPIISYTSNDTVFVYPQFVIGSQGYLIELKNNNSNPSSKTYYSICLSSALAPSRNSCPSSYNGNPLGCNLVCNGDFECLNAGQPLNTSDLSFACGWYDGNGGSCDLFSPTFTCPAVGVPCNYFGYEPAQSGSNYAGFIPSDPSYPFQEYMETKLISPLIANQLYFGSFYVSLADLSAFFPNNISIYFRNAPELEPGHIAYTISPAITLTSTPTWSTQVGWTNLTFTYIPASSGAQYMIIGQNGPSTYSGSATTSCFTGPYNYPYVYIDNISLVQGPKINVISPICTTVPASFNVDCALASTTTFSWNWGDSSPTYTTNVPNTTHSYTAAGTYTAILTSWVPGNSYTTSAVVTVTPPTASFSYTSNCSNTLFSSAVSCSTTSMYYSWQFGDGGTYASSSYSTAYTYTGAGTYIATLTVNWSPTSSWTGTTSVTVQETPTITINSTGGSLCAANNQTFTAVINPSGSYSYSWSATAGTISPGTQTTSALGMNFTGISSTAVLTLSLTGTSCSTTATYSVFPCCSTVGATSVFPTGYTFTSSVTYTSGVYILNNATVASGVMLAFHGCEVKMNPNSMLNTSSSSTLELLTSYVHGCTAQWNSIRTAPTCTIDFESCIVEDAQRVVVDSLGSGYLQALNSIFNRNYKGFVFVKPTTSMVLNIKNNAFTNADFTGSAISYTIPVANTASVTNAAGTYSALPGLNLLPPYSSITAKTGMECVNTTSTSSGYIKLGHSITNPSIGNGNQNIFHHLSEGIATYNSKVQVLNQYFQYCTSAPNSAGVYIYGSPLTSGISDVKIGTLTTEKCYFYSNTYGVLNTLPSAVSIQRCSFVDNTRGIYMNNNSKNKTTSVSTNTFTNNDIGVKMEDNGWMYGQVTSNTFTNSVARATYANNYAIYASETAAPTNTTNYANYYIFSNTIDGYYNGIFVSNTYSPSILTNSMTLRASTVTANYQEGIEITLCNTPTVKLNTIAISGGTYTANWQNGILTNANTLPSVICNSVTGLGSAITIQGYNWTSANGSGYCNNSLNNFGYGIWMDMGAEIGDQYFYYSSTKYASDNQWLSSLSGSFRTKVTGLSNNIYLNGATLYTRGTPSQYSIALAQAFPNGPSCQPAYGCALMGNNSSGTTSVSACSSGGGGGSGSPMSMTSSSTPTLDIIQPALDIAQGNLAVLQSNENLKWLNERTLYQNLVLQNINTSSYSDITTFKNQTSNNNIGKFYNVDASFNDAIATGSKASLALASGINNSVKATNLIEWNQKAVNNTYLSYLNNGYKLDNTQIADLENIAQQCPLTNGYAVYQARTMIFNYTGKKYISECEHTQTNDSPSTSSRFSNSQIFSSSEGGVKVYPNPGSNEIFVETGSYNNCELVIYTLLGQETIKQTLNNNKTKVDISQLNNGTYFYRIIQGENVILRDKLIVAH